MRRLAFLFGFLVSFSVHAVEAEDLVKYNALNLSLGYSSETFDYSINSQAFSDFGRGIAVDLRYFDSSKVFGGLSLRYRNGEQFPTGGAFNFGVEFGGYISMWTVEDGAIGEVLDWFPEWFDIGTGASVTVGYHHFSGVHPLYEPYMSAIGNGYTFVRLWRLFFSYNVGLEARFGLISKQWEPDWTVEADSFPLHHTFQAGWFF